MTSRAGGGADSLSSTASKGHGKSPPMNHGTNGEVKRPRGRPPKVSVPLQCGICSADLISEPNSIRCDSCKLLFHPSCLGGFAPYDNEEWHCQGCSKSNQTDYSPVSQAIAELRQSTDTGTDHTVSETVAESKSVETTDEDNIEDARCPVCKVDVSDHDAGIVCEGCNVWSHAECLQITEEEYAELVESDEDWYCITCQMIRANRIKWGTLEGEDAISESIKSIYLEITTWRKNLFLLPRGNNAIAFIKELTKLINLFVDDTPWKRLSLTLVHIFIPIMLQKPAAKSKAKVNAKYLAKRLEWWKCGALTDLMSEAREIQNRLKKTAKLVEESNKKAFCRLMFLGKVGQAVKFINNDSSIKGVHKLDRKVKASLTEKHPVGVNASTDVMLDITTPESQAVIFESITAEEVHQAAKNTNGSGGPTLIDADGWKHILCSRSYGKSAEILCGAIAGLAKKLATEEVDPDILSEFVACRLVPLDKGADKDGNIGVRPVGVGEVLRRIIGKIVIDVIKYDIQAAVGPLQTCAGLRSGIEASIHVTKEVWDEPETEGVILVDADNAFNRINRQLAVHNTRELCPPFHRYLSNTYSNAARLVVNDEHKTEYLLSDEGCTQGDVAAMAFYALGIRPLTVRLSEVIEPNSCKQCWYADDSSAIGKLLQMKRWWDELVLYGPKYGYHPKPSKTVLIVKSKSLLQEAKEIFAGTGIKIETEGERHLGAVLGTQKFREAYVAEKVVKWVKDVEELSEIAQEEPQAALTAFNKAICRRWTFIQRTMSNISHLFAPLENIIRNKFIPAVVGRHISDIEREILSLPVRLGGIGIENPVISADREYSGSMQVTETLSMLIKRQEQTLDNYNQTEVDDIVTMLKGIKEEALKQKLKSILSEVDENTARALQLAQERGSGAWLNALPIQSLKYVLNKEEFRDSIRLRYGWTIPNMPSFCVCGEKNGVQHALTCPRGGHVIFRHNRLRDVDAEYLRQVCYNVQVEPELMPVKSPEFKVIGKNTERARLDIAANGLWGPFQKTMFDVRVFHPNCKSYKNKNLKDLYKMHEKQKIKDYQHRVLQTEKASFTPLIYSTNGGLAPQAEIFHKRLASLIAEKKNERYSDVMNHMRTDLSFTMLRSVLTSIRGVRGRKIKGPKASQTFLSYNLIEERSNYESY